MMKRGYTTNPDCPRCGENKTSNHVIQCQQPEATNVWNNLISELKLWLLSAQTDPTITNVIFEGLSRCQQSLPNTRINCATTDQQITIGRVVFLEGRAGIEWQHAQARYFSKVGSKQRVCGGLLP
jgi:hypothetical protein